MTRNDPFWVEFSEDNRVQVEFSDEFLSSSREEQIKAMEAFFRQKTLEPYSTLDVSRDAVKHEVTIVLVESILANLRRGEPVHRDGRIDVSLEDLVTV